MTLRFQGIINTTLMLTLDSTNIHVLLASHDPTATHVGSGREKSFMFMFLFNTRHVYDIQFF